MQVLGLARHWDSELLLTCLQGLAQDQRVLATHTALCSYFVADKGHLLVGWGGITLRHLGYWRLKRVPQYFNTTFIPPFPWASPGLLLEQKRVQLLPSPSLGSIICRRQMLSSTRTVFILCLYGLHCNEVQACHLVPEHNSCISNSLQSLVRDCTAALCCPQPTHVLAFG